MVSGPPRPSRRGATAAGFGAGACESPVVPSHRRIAASGLPAGFLAFACGPRPDVFVLAIFHAQAAICHALALKRAVEFRRPGSISRATVLRSPIFWVMYLVFVMVAAGGLMVRRQIAPIAADSKIANEPVGSRLQMALDFRDLARPYLRGFGRPFLDGCPTKSAASTRCSSHLEPAH